MYGVTDILVFHALQHYTKASYLHRNLLSNSCSRQLASLELVEALSVEIETRSDDLSLTSFAYIVEILTNDSAGQEVVCIVVSSTNPNDFYEEKNKENLEESPVCHHFFRL